MRTSSTDRFFVLNFRHDDSFVSQSDENDNAQIKAFQWTWGEVNIRQRIQSNLPSPTATDLKSLFPLSTPDLAFTSISRSKH